VEPRPSVPTLANAMDVGNPSNLERLQWLFGGDVAAMRQLVSASVHTDDDVRRAIRELDQKFGYVADPHTAIAYLGTLGPPTLAPGVPASFGEVSPKRPSAAKADTPGTLRHLFLSTAHPAKFREVVEPVIGRPVPLPPALAEALARPRIVQRLAKPVLGGLAALL
jgi:threonine synthase